MAEFPVTHDPERDVILLAGSGGVAIMLTFLLKAKFGEAFDPEVLFHAPLAELMTSLAASVPPPAAPDAGPFTREQIFRIGREIVSESWRSGWWRKSQDERVKFVQDVVVAPYKLSSQQLEQLFDDIESDLYWRRRVVSAADEAGEPPVR